MGLVHKGQDCWQAAAEVAWSMCIVRNISQGKISVKHVLLCKEEIGARNIDEASNLHVSLASDLASKLDK